MESCRETKQTKEFQVASVAEGSVKSNTEEKGEKGVDQDLCMRPQPIYAWLLGHYYPVLHFQLNAMNELDHHRIGEPGSQRYHPQQNTRNDAKAASIYLSGVWNAYVFTLASCLRKTVVHLGSSASTSRRALHHSSLVFGSNRIYSEYQTNFTLFST